MLLCEWYAVTTLTITTLWVYSARNYSFSTLAWAMFFPGMFAPWFSENPDFLWDILGLNKLYNTVTHSVLAVFLNLMALSLAMATSYICGWGHFTNAGMTSGEGRRLRLSVAGFLRAAGEEVGWRCYLLPCLLNHYNTQAALTICGIVWALFHAPVMVLLTHRLSIRPRWRTILVQTLSVFLTSYSYGWIAIHTQFSLWAPTLMHFTWNSINPLILGSIYTQAPGKYMTGPQWLINGEGAAGCVAWLVISSVIWKTSSYIRPSLF